MTASVLVVEDQVSAGRYLQLLLHQEGYQAELARDGVQALVALERDRFDLVIADLRMPRMDGLELLFRLKQRWPELPVIVITAASETSAIVEAVQLGAVNYLVKPAPPAAVIGAVEKALAVRRQPSAAQRGGGSIPEIVGSSSRIVEVRQQIAVATQSDMPVLITGSTGTGKELVARAIHRYSNLGNGPFVPHNCSVSPADLFDSVFFGHCRGAFTGADRDHTGLIMQSDGGVLFLDELETLLPSHQARLLRVLDDGEVRAVGSEKPAQVSVRFLAATNLDPRTLISEGGLREDLYYRLRGIEIELPPLSERRDDIPLLAQHFFADGSPGFLPEAVDALTHAPWPGNVRQLRNVVRSASAAGGAAKIGVRHLALDGNAAPGAGKATPGEVPSHMTLKDLEHRAIAQAIEECQGNRTRAARILGIDRSTLRRKLEEYGGSR